MFLIDTPGWLDHWESVLRYTVIILSIYLAVLWLTIIFWTYRDIRQRSRDPIVQTAATLLVLVFFLPGLWIYQILRPRYTLVELYERSLEEEALLQELEDQKACPTCKRRVMDEYLICPSCRTQLKEACRSCSRPLSYAWMACPFCGLEKAPRESFAPRQQRPAIRATAPAPPPVRGPEPAARSVAPLRAEHRVSRSAPAAPAAPPAPARAAVTPPPVPELSPWPAEGPAPVPAAPVAQPAPAAQTVAGPSAPKPSAPPKAPVSPATAASANGTTRITRSRDPFAPARQSRGDEEPQKSGPVIGTGAPETDSLPTT